jgi:GNAT superfamily N-acetyltransferase
MIPHRITVRQAVPADERTISDLSLAAHRVVLHIAWTELRRALVSTVPHVDQPGQPDSSQHRVYNLYLCERDGQPGCLWASVIEPQCVAQLRALILEDEWPLSHALAALLPTVIESLRATAVTTLAFVGVEQWLLDGLAANGFSLSNTIVTLHKEDWTIPSWGNGQAIVRPVTDPDLAQILEIDERAFIPLWRNTPLTLAEFRQVCPYFCVAELEGQIVGYVYATLRGRHGHLARIAVDPRQHGRQIGVRMLAEVMQFFRDARVYGVTVNTQRNNVRARRLYQWFGFVLMGQEAEVWTITP